MIAVRRSPWPLRSSGKREPILAAQPFADPAVPGLMHATATPRRPKPPPATVIGPRQWPGSTAARLSPIPLPKQRSQLRLPALRRWRRSELRTIRPP